MWTSAGCLLPVYMAAVALTAAAAQEVCFSEVDGNIPIEMESAPALSSSSSFIPSTRVPGASNNTHLFYIGRNSLNAPNLDDVLEYKVFSPFGGDYVLHLRASRDRIGTSIRDDGANDIFVNLPLLVTPDDRRFIKMFLGFGSTDLEWRWTTRLELKQTKFRADLRLTPGVNSVFFSGRSRRFCPDRMAFVKRLSSRNDLLSESRVYCDSGLLVGDTVNVVSPETVSCLKTASEVVVSLYNVEFLGVSCNFGVIERSASAFCSSGICDGKSEAVCRRRLTGRLRRRFMSRTICPPPVTETPLPSNIPSVQG